MGVETALVLLGNERLILPSGKVGPVAFPEFALAMLLEPEPEEMRTWLGRLETTLKVTDEHRQLMADRAVTLGESREAKRRRLLDQSMRATAAQTPMRDPVVARVIKIKLRAAGAHRRRAAELREVGAKKHRSLVRRLQAKAVALIEAAEGLRQAEAEADRLYGEAKESILRARAQGADVVTRVRDTAEIARDEHGARIIHRRGENQGLPALIYDRGVRAKKLTGLEHALEAGYLDPHWARAQRLHQIGVQYREAYEIAEGGTSSGGEGGGGFGPKAPQPRRAEASLLLDDMRAGLSDRQRRVLDLVCGEDLRAREAATRLGAGFPATVRALRGGLVAAAASARARQDERLAAGTASDLRARIALGNRLLRNLRT